MKLVYYSKRKRPNILIKTQTQTGESTKERLSSWKKHGLTIVTTRRMLLNPNNTCSFSAHFN